VAAGDLFGRLGLHWADSPAKLEPAVRALRLRYGPGSPVAHRSPVFAARRLALAEEAFTSLSTASDRRRYRYEQLKVDARSTAQLLTQQAMIDLRRGELESGRDKLEAAIDLEPTQARRDLLARLTARGTVP
jgi:hypothetical protein